VAFTIVILIVAAVILLAALGSNSTSKSSPAATRSSTSSSSSSCSAAQSSQMRNELRLLLEGTGLDPATVLDVTCDGSTNILRVETNLFRKVENAPEGVGVCVNATSILKEVGLPESMHVQVGTPDGGVLASTDINGFCQQRK
jgi:hypothetical protein